MHMDRQRSRVGDPIGEDVAGPKAAESEHVQTWCVRVQIAFAPMRVWIDQDLCTGDGLCVDHCPDVFTLLDDGIAYVVESGQVLNDPGGSGSLAAVAPRQERDVIEAADVCPGECIFIEVPVPELVESVGVNGDGWS